MSLPGVDAQLRARNLARGLQDSGVQDDAVDVSVRLVSGRDSSFKPSNISAGLNEVFSSTGVPREQRGMGLPKTLTRRIRPRRDYRHG